MYGKESKLHAAESRSGTDYGPAGRRIRRRINAGAQAQTRAEQYGAFDGSRHDSRRHRHADNTRIKEARDE